MSPSATINGAGGYGQSIVDGLVQEGQKSKKTSLAQNQDIHDKVLKTFRLLIADLCEQFGGGHPGGAIGMAAIGVALWKYTMRYAPHTPDYFNRDRFVLSNGHTCLFQYCFLHLAGYKNMTMDELKSYHSESPHALCPGHPEIEHEGIEVTTGPLGQGVANAVGFAMATKQLAATYNRPGFDIVNNHTWCMIGDACLQEGVALEAMSFAGHLGLSNLTIIYDNNQVTCDGSVDLTNTEDVNTKMAACGWDVIDVEDGCFDIDALVAALHKARESPWGKPTFINVRTIIGVGSTVAGDAVAHGAAFGAEEVSRMKEVYGFNTEEHFIIGEDVLKFFEDIPSKGQELVSEWNSLLDRYSAQHSELAQELHNRMQGKLPQNWESYIPESFPTASTATRKSAGLVFNPIAKECNSFMVGTADLSPSVNMMWKGKRDFQNPLVNVSCGINGDYSGRYIHYGVREHAMAGISNGLAAFNPGTIIPVTSSFFMFYLYAAPAVRMGALQRLQVIHVATHDSIGTGEDGPTHQPIELAALYRAMPNILYMRPADSEETAGAWRAAIESKNEPSIISLSRHNLPQLTGTSRDKVARGAYVLEEAEDADVTLIGTGSELCFAVEMAVLLRQKGWKVRVVSFPCQRLFDRQDTLYKKSVLRRHEGVPAVVVEAYAVNGWERYADAGFSMHGFGKSMPGKAAYKYFGFTPEAMVERMVGWWEQEGEGRRRAYGEFVDLMLM